MSEESCTGSDSLLLIEEKIEKVRKQIEESASARNHNHLNKVEKLNQKLRYLEYYRDHAVIPVRGATYALDGAQGINWCRRCKMVVESRTPCFKCQTEKGKYSAAAAENVRFESEETILTAVRKSIRRDFDAMVRSERNMKSKLKSGKLRETRKELRERSRAGDW